MWRPILATTGQPQLDETVAGVRVLDVTHPARLALALTETENDEPTVVVSHPGSAHATRTAASFLVAHRPGWRVATLTSTHAPLTVLATLSTARQLAGDAGRGISAWRDLLDRAWSGAVLTSVTRLDDPNPTLGQHVRSWLPGSRFLVRQAPEPLTVSASQPGLAVAGLARGEHDVVVTPQGSDDPLTAQLVSALAPGRVQHLAVPGDWSALYGRREEFQVALVPTDPRGVVRPAGPACPGCGLAAAEPICDFCRTRTAGTARPEAFESLIDDPLAPAGRTS